MDELPAPALRLQSWRRSREASATAVILSSPNRSPADGTRQDECDRPRDAHQSTPSGSRISVAALAPPLGHRRCQLPANVPAVVRGECLIDGRLPHAIVARCVTSRRDERGAEAPVLSKQGCGNVTAPATASFSTSSHITARAPWWTLDKEREPKAGSKGGRTTVKRNRRGRGAGGGPGPAPARYLGDF